MESDNLMHRCRERQQDTGWSFWRSFVGMFLWFVLLSQASGAGAIRVITAKNASPRELFAAERLRQTIKTLPTPPASASQILLATRSSLLLRSYKLAQFRPGAEEAFLLRRLGNTVVVAGSDASGVLYGALELASRIQQAHGLPADLDYQDHPALRLRGTCIGMQKPEITYEGAEYDYLYTPEGFPFFYDKAAWTRYLDMLVNQRMNTLYLWNGHPFTSLLKLPRYPEAQELPDTQLEQNREMFRWLTSEADKRGIWVLEGFYNIHLSHSFARAHHLPYHLSAPNQLASDYTRYAISQFIEQYPNVGLMMTLGEALSPNHGAEWLAGTIIPGVRDGLRALGTSVEPPIVVRDHATDIRAVLAAALPLYKNIDTLSKWNGESLTWTNVRGPVLEKQKLLVANANVAISNIHLLSNLEPFRWGFPEFMRQTIVNFQKIGIGGVHIYPLRYWDWPNSADNPPLLQTDRDWIWFEAWSRYAWNPNRDPQKEHAFWVSRFAEKYGSREAGERLLRAYELSGACAPRLLPRIGITEGNRQAFSLGMLMTQLIDAERYNPATTLWTGDAPPGERLDEYVLREVNHKAHDGDTPIGAANDVAESSATAVRLAEEAGVFVTRNHNEYRRVLNDMRCIHALMQFYRAKTHAAALVMRFAYDHNADDLKQAELLLAESLEHFRHLTELTEGTYRQACSIHTSQRQIPVRGGPGRYTHWRDVLPIYERELAIFRERMQRMGASVPETAQAAGRLPQVGFQLLPGAGETFQVEPDTKLYTDSDATITSVDPELRGLTGIRVSSQQSTPLHFTLEAPAQILVGFFKRGGKNPPASPDTEQWNLLLLNAVSLTKNLPLAVWARPLPEGNNDLDLGKGAYVVLGFIPQGLDIKPRVSFQERANSVPNLDWLFEN